MTIKTKRVNIEEVKPNPSNIRKTFNNLEELAASFATNKENPGEPFNMPLLVEEAEGYVIIDGERRWQAMKVAGTRSFLARVSDSYEEADVVLAMLATNNEDPLTAEEKAQGVQKSLELGAEFEEVERAAGLAKGTAAKLAAGIRGAKSAVQTPSLERWLAVAEFEGDEEAQQALAECNENELRWLPNRIRATRKAQKEFEALETQCEELGIELTTEKPKRAELVIKQYGFDNENRDALKEIVGDGGDGLIMSSQQPNLSTWPSLTFEVYRKSTEDEGTLISNNALKRSMTEDKRRRASWVAKRFGEGGMKGLRNTGRMFEKREAANPYSLGGFVKKAGDEFSVPIHASEWMIALRWELVDDMTQATLLAISKGKTKECCTSTTGLANEAERFVEFLNALVADGYKPSDSESALMENCKALKAKPAKAA